MTIKKFDGEFRFLSNFFPAEVVLDEMQFPTVEHAYQAAKTHDQKQRTAIQQAATPGQAKRLGRKIFLRRDWDFVKLGIMEDLLRQKFTRYAHLRGKLLATGDAQLIEGNTWGDTFWGVCNRRGRNHLGRILMKVREEIRSINDEKAGKAVAVP